ncbi:MAG: hypothetical protein IKO26_11020 [Paludibacteraceae bacterium]|nr:hypothetical protein [Paludibacteraceae bacterium]
MSMQKNIEVVSVNVLRDNLQRIEHYDNPDRAFETLLYGFYKKRYGVCAANSAAQRTLKRGCLTVRMAKLFARYVGYDIVQA